MEPLGPSSTLSEFPIAALRSNWRKVSSTDNLQVICCPSLMPGIRSSAGCYAEQASLFHINSHNDNDAKAVAQAFAEGDECACGTPNTFKYRTLG
jgi:hypothetical protein